MNETVARRLVYARSGGVCEICDQRPGTNWHHRRSAGRIWTPENGLHLCGSGTTGCHGWVTSHPSVSRQLGWMVSNSVAPERVHAVLALVRGRWAALESDGATRPLSWHLKAAPDWVPEFVPLRLARSRRPCPPGRLPGRTPPG
jgi:hypothetical protein